MMNIEINATMKRTRPTNSNEAKQTANATIETANKIQWNNFKDKVTKVQDRLRIVSFAIQAIPTGIAMSREVNKITQNQTDIINEINTAPYSIIAVLPSQVQFVDDLQMVTRLIVLELLFLMEPSTRWKNQNVKFYWIMHWEKSKH